MIHRSRRRVNSPKGERGMYLLLIPTRICRTSCQLLLPGHCQVLHPHRYPLNDRPLRDPYNHQAPVMVPLIFTNEETRFIPRTSILALKVAVRRLLGVMSSTQTRGNPKNSKTAAYTRLHNPCYRIRGIFKLNRQNTILTLHLCNPRTIPSDKNHIHSCPPGKFNPRFPLPSTPMIPFRPLSATSALLKLLQLFHQVHLIVVCSQSLIRMASSELAPRAPSSKVTKGVKWTEWLHTVLLRMVLHQELRRRLFRTSGHRPLHQYT